MATHSFPIRAYARPAAGLRGMGYVPPFLTEQENRNRITLGCPCNEGMGGNWYSYPQDQRQMYGITDFLNPLNNTLFTIPVVNVNVTTTRLIVAGAAAFAVSWLMKR